MEKKHCFLALAAAVLFLAGLYPLEWYWLSWFAFLPLFLIFLDSDRRLTSLIAGTLAVGFLYYGIGLYWLLYYQIWIYAACLALIAPIFTLYFLVLKFLTSRISNISLRVLTACFLWLAIQKLYALSPLGTIGTEAPFYGPLPFFQIASVTGFSAFAGIIVGLNASLALFIRKRAFASIFWILFFTLSASGLYFWGKNELSNAEPQGEVKLALIQHNLPVSGEWWIDHTAYIRFVYRKLALKAAKEKPQMIIFPLYNFPQDVLRNPEFFADLARKTQSYILVASYIPERPGSSIFNGFFDMAILYSPKGEIADSYTAVERPPFRDTSELTTREYKVLATPFAKLGILLCYEDSVSRVSKKAVQKGADILIALSNPGHFAATHMPYYHLMQDRLRAIESGRSLVRASSNGYSALVDPKGRFVTKSHLNREEILQIKVSKNRGVTLYHRYGDAAGLASLIIIFGLFIFRLTKR